MTGRCPVLKSACACCRGSMKEEQDHCQIGGVWICLHSSNSWQKSATIFSQGVCSPLQRTSLLQCLCAKKKEDDRAMPSVAICRCRESCITIVGKGRCPVFQCETECCQAKLFWTMMRLLYNLRGFKMILTLPLLQNRPWTWNKDWFESQWKWWLSWGCRSLHNSTLEEKAQLLGQQIVVDEVQLLGQQKDLGTGETLPQSWQIDGRYSLPLAAALFEVSSFTKRFDESVARTRTILKLASWLNRLNNERIELQYNSASASGQCHFTQSRKAEMASTSSPCIIPIKFLRLNVSIQFFRVLKNCCVESAVLHARSTISKFPQRSSNCWSA